MPPSPSRSARRDTVACLLLTLLVAATGQAGAHELGELPDGGFESSYPSGAHSSDAGVNSASLAEGLSPDAGQPESPPEPPVFQTVIRSRRPYTAASSSVVRNDDFSSRPLLDPSDVLEVTPGLFTVQHAGGGKANQYFLRGFDIDHGTDLAISVDGVPVNMVSHAHGQGYADLHFVIPELVEKLEVTKGPYSAERGDFATAGSTNLVLRRRFDENLVKLTAGSFDTWRGLLVAAPEVGEEVESYLAAELYGTNGPFQSPENLRRVNLVGKATYAPSPRIEVSLTAMAYTAGWDASNQIPLRAVESGQLGRFGAVDPSDGGTSSRHSLLAAVHHHDENGGQALIEAYLVRYQMKLFSNFTFFATDPLFGDQLEQVDHRWLTGFEGRYRKRNMLGPVELVTTGGVRLRNDEVETSLNQTVEREKVATSVDALVSETSLGAFLEGELTWNRYLRIDLGLRADLFTFSVEDRLEDLTSLGNSTSGEARRMVASPKASLVLSPTSRSDLFLNFGRGFHSNDARGVVREVDGASPLAQATGYEVGARAAFGEQRRVDVAVAVWGLDLDGEIVWVGDEGTTEERGATRRLGVEAEVRMRILPWLRADVDATVTRARFREDTGAGSRIPLAPLFTLAGGLQANHRSGIFGSVRVQRLGERPAIEDSSVMAQGFTLMDVQAGYQLRRFRFVLDVKNALGAKWRQAQFVNESRLPGESAPVQDLHFTSGAPRAVFGTVAVSL